jgi:hypothetical protein
MKIMTKDKKIKRSEALAFRRRWKIINALEKEELRNTPESKKLGQLAVLIQFAREIGRESEKERKAVQDRWNMLRKGYRG